MTDVPERVSDRPTEPSADGSSGASSRSAEEASPTNPLLRFVRELVVIVVIALIASALLRAFVLQAFFVPSGSMLPEIQLHDRIVVSRIGDIERGRSSSSRTPAAGYRSVCNRSHRAPCVARWSGSAYSPRPVTSTW